MGIHWVALQFRCWHSLTCRYTYLVFQFNPSSQFWDVREICYAIHFSKAVTLVQISGHGVKGEQTANGREIHMLPGYMRSPNVISLWLYLYYSKICLVFFQGSSVYH